MPLIDDVIAECLRDIAPDRAQFFRLDSQVAALCRVLDSRFVPIKRFASGYAEGGEPYPYTAKPSRRK